MMMGHLKSARRMSIHHAFRRRLEKFYIGEMRIYGDEHLHEYTQSLVRDLPSTANGVFHLIVYIFDHVKEALELAR